jgi:hypothetical protein
MFTASRSRAALPLICALLCFPPALRAQVDVVEEAESRRPERQLEIEEAVKRAAQEAEERRALESAETVTYEQVLADPDNLELNFRFAQAQVARGDLVGASATLERILMIEPNLPPIRLFYALVLFRLDNLEDAEREFRILREAQLPDDKQQQVEQYLRQIRRRRQRTVVTASLSMGWGFDSNRNAAPSSEQRLLADIPLDLTGTSRLRRDTNVLAISSFSVTHDLGTQAGHQLIGSLDYFLGEQTSADDLDLQSFSLEGGALIRTPAADLIPTVFANYLYLGRESFLRGRGARLRLTRLLTDRLRGTVEGSWTDEDFLPITENTAAPERTGGRANAILGAQYLLNPAMQLGAELAYEDKNVSRETRYNAYEGVSLTGSHTWLLGAGQFLLSSLTGTVQSYDEPDPAISARKRRDEQVRARLTYGTPVAPLVGEWLPASMLEDLTATLSVEQFRSLSNIRNYTYKNTKLGVMFTKRLEF